MDKVRQRKRLILTTGSNKSDSLHVRDVLTNDERWGVPTARRNDISRVVGFFDPVLPDARQDHRGDFVLRKCCKCFCYRNKPYSTLPLLGYDHSAKKKRICRGIRTSFS